MIPSDGSTRLNLLLADGRVAEIIINVLSPLPLATTTIPAETDVTFPVTGGTKDIACVTKDQWGQVIPGVIPIVSSNDPRVGVSAGPDRITINAVAAQNAPNGGYTAKIQVLP